MNRKSGFWVAREGWTNITLVQCDAAAYGFPQAVQGVVDLCADFGPGI